MRAALASLCLLVLLGCGKSQPPTPPAPVADNPAQPAATSSAQPPAAAPAWLDDASTAALPESSAAGMLGGRPFAVRQANLENGILHLNDSDEFVPDNRFIVFLFLDKGAVPQGKAFVVGKKGEFGNPHVHVGWKDAAGKMDSQAYMDKYTMRLEFGAYANGRLPAASTCACRIPPKAAWPEPSTRR